MLHYLFKGSCILETYKSTPNILFLPTPETRVKLLLRWNNFSYIFQEQTHGCPEFRYKKLKSTPDVDDDKHYKIGMLLEAVDKIYPQYTSVASICKFLTD